MAEDLSPGLHDPPIVERHALDPAAHPLAGFKHDHIGPDREQIARRGQPREPGPKDSHIDHPRTTSPQRPQLDTANARTTNHA